MSPSPRLSPALSSPPQPPPEAFKCKARGSGTQEDTPTNEERGRRGALRESPRPLGPAGFTETSRQGLGLGELGGGGLESLHTYPNATTRQHHEHPLCQEACRERPRCVES